MTHPDDRPPPPRLHDSIQAALIARAMVGDDWKAHDDLEPEGETVAEVIDHWFACRVDVFDVGLGHMRWCLTEQDVRHLVEHLQRWRDGPVP